MVIHPLIRRDIATSIYDVLVEHAGASSIDSERNSFIILMTMGDGCSEFRFKGSLGFGGKLRNIRGRPWYVDCYPEDANPERERIIEVVNKELCKIWDRSCG